MCSEQYVFSNRGHRLSTRLTLPKQPEHTLGYVIYIHGYGAHSNRPHVQTMAKQLREANYGMITFDFHGHGYSTGKRCYIDKYEHLIDDAFSVLFNLFFFKLQYYQTEIDSKLPFYMMGHSMGGCVSLISSLILSHSFDMEHNLMTPYIVDNAIALQSISKRFSGLILFAPLISLPISEMLIKYIIKPLTMCCPNECFPQWVVDENDANYLCWSNKAYRKYIEYDGYPKNPYGLSYGSNIKFKTLLSLYEMCEAVNSSTLHLNVPVVIYQDEHDTTCKYEFTVKYFHEKCKTSFRLEKVIDGFHDILANKTNDAIQNVLDDLYVFAHKSRSTNNQYVGGSM